MSTISINNSKIGRGQPVFLIAEAGINHNGDIAKAHQLIEAAQAAGADAVKFQTFITNEVIATDAPLAKHMLTNVGQKQSHYKLVSKLELPFEAFVELKQHCEESGLVFISTPYDSSSAQWLLDIKSEIIKIASSELTNFPLLDIVGRSKIPVLLSTGMSTWEEIVGSVEFLEQYHKDICILKCTSNYPASPEGANLLGITKLAEKFPHLVIGFSDHSEGNEISLAAVSFGVSVIERHFTLNKKLWGPDHRASMTPNEFARLVSSVRKIERAFGIKDWEVQKEELSQRETMRKGTYAKHDIKKNQTITMADVKFLRPSGKISPKDFYLHYRNRLATKTLPGQSELGPEDFQ